jgi:ABC-type phosphate/phosphonate transport system substrate-binding protein
MKRGIVGLMTVLLVFAGFSGDAMASDAIGLWFPPAWAGREAEARAIAQTLSTEAEVEIRAEIAKNYPEILSAFESGAPALVYAGSFVQTLIHLRQLGRVLVQSVNGREFYSGVLIYPADADPEDRLSRFPERVAFAVGASSGESSAKAATEGKAAIGVASHWEAARAVASGRAKAAFVKNWWWEDHRKKFPGLNMKSVPGISENKNPDNLLAASQSVPPETVSAIIQTTLVNPDLFGGQQMVLFDLSDLIFPKTLMKRAGIDPAAYQW